MSPLPLLSRAPLPDQWLELRLRFVIFHLLFVEEARSTKRALPLGGVPSPRDAGWKEREVILCPNR
jgi:hypothetical protein